MSPTNFLLPMVVIACLIASAVTASAETGRIKRKPPTDLEAERIASEMAMSDSLLQRIPVAQPAAGDGGSSGSTPEPWKPKQGSSSFSHFQPLQHLHGGGKFTPNDRFDRSSVGN